jgi:hypothetical protein
MKSAASSSAEPPISLDPAGLAAAADLHLRLDHTGRPSSSAASTASGTRVF